MKRFLVGLLALALSFTSAFATSIPTTGAGKASGGGGGGGQTSTWDVAAGNAAGATFTYSATNVANDTITFLTGSSTAIATPVFPANQSGKWYWEYKLIAVAGVETRLGVTSNANNTYIGNFGGDPATRAMRMDGTFAAAAGSIPSQQTITTLTTGAVIGVYVDLATGQFWLTPDNVTFWGSGGSTTQTASQVIAGTGGWVASTDNRTRAPGVSFLDPSNTVQLLAGTNITRTPLTGFTVIP